MRNRLCDPFLITCLIFTRKESSSNVRRHELFSVIWSSVYFHGPLKSNILYVYLFRLVYYIISLIFPLRRNYSPFFPEKLPTETSVV